ncbi:FAD-dependent oxidoreductase [Streptomyces sp. NPDC020707]|uniref:FAD-dependent oxidoreductase n=1 Tax=Streptomyces sp. NPDC020707 TaxID=3365084 RepID=UPI00378929B7
MSSKNVVDYIIVGGGPAGSALAHRLGANPQNRVLVIEAGSGSDLGPRPPVPANLVRASSSGSPYMRHYAHRPYDTDRTEQRLTGRALGGSPTAPGLIWDRGGEADYDAWEAAGITGWNRSRFEQAFTAMEKNALGVTGGRDVGSPRRPEAPGPPDLASAWWIDALARHGIEAAEDLNVRHEQAAYASLSTWNGARTSGPRALLRGYGRRSNVRVRTHCEVRRILFDGTTATGVEAKTRRGTVRFTARREVVLCAGTTGSPLLLERSGVGDPEVLTAAGVHLVAANLYESVLEFELTDYRAPGLYFFRNNTAHHSIALARAATPSIHHLEFEYDSLDDVGRAYDRAKANGEPISISLGRHMNDKAISFYVRNPSGFHLEIGCGGIEVGEHWVPHDFGVPDVWGHHHASANPFASPTS